MYKDIISYELAVGVSKEHLLSVGKQIVNEWMKKQQGFISWEVNSSSDGKFTDIVCWDSKEAAKIAEKEMINIPNAAEWYRCYKQDSISCISVFLEEKL